MSEETKPANPLLESGTQLDFMQKDLKSLGRLLRSNRAGSRAADQKSLSLSHF
jgi:hypothetical protein